MTTRHTKTPWFNDHGTIRNKDGQVIAECHVYDQNTNKLKATERDENAAFIVDACNNHWGLMFVLRSDLKVLRGIPLRKLPIEVVQAIKGLETLLGEEE